MIVSERGTDGVEYGLFGSGKEGASWQSTGISHEVLSLCFFLEGELVIMEGDGRVWQ